VFDLPEQFDDKWFLAFAFTPSDQTPVARQRYEALLESAAQGRS
jgi:hypothetical protein